MAEAMTETTVVPVSMGTLTENDYETLIVAAMLPSGGTEVAPPVEIAVEPEKLAIVAETALVQPPKAKPPRVCKICGHADGNSVGRIKPGRIIEVLRDGMKMCQIEETCEVCIEQMSPEERAKIGRIGYLISLIGLRNRRIRAMAAAAAYWTAVKVGTAEPLQARCDAQGKVLCGVPDCKLCRDGELATRFAVVKNAEGKRAVAGICREQMAILINAGALRHIQLFDHFGAQMELERRQKKDAAEAVPPPKPEPAPIAATPVVEPEKPALASQPVPVKKLSRAERETRRWDRRRQRALAVGNTRFGTGKRHKGGQKGSNGGKKR